MSDLTIKSGDRYATIWRVPGVKFTDEIVRLLAQRGFHPVIELPTEIVGGAVVHVLDGSLDVTGEYHVELEIRQSDGTVITAPTATYVTLRVITDLD